MAYTPEADSLAGRVCAFFRAQQTAELSTVEIALQFGKPTSSIPALLANCVHEKLIARRKDAQMNTLWFAGPALHRAGAEEPRGVMTKVAPKSTGPVLQAPAAEAPPAGPATTCGELPDLSIAGKVDAGQEIAALKELMQQQFTATAVPKHLLKPDAAAIEFAQQIKQLQLSLDLAANATCALIHLLDRVDPALPDEQRATAEEYQLTRRFAKSALAVIERGAAA